MMREARCCRLPLTRTPLVISRHCSALTHSLTLPRFPGRCLTRVQIRESELEHLDRPEVVDERKPNLQDDKVVIVEGDGEDRRQVTELYPGDIILPNKNQPGFDVMEVYKLMDGEYGLLLMSTNLAGTTTTSANKLRLSEMLQPSITGNVTARPTPPALTFSCLLAREATPPPCFGRRSASSTST
eukprot:TRINITY_DN3239_c0_g2_i1.p1 TRINITY_DN3239_c0_g2~~TRINITY_DN3239_c0_g2_i1.p1  ORF type:complete len:185 (-),score=31.43 TRINITY_DN3239_c0_g2_i1:365-919(-)